jgi:hypothetical protein
VLIIKNRKDQQPIHKIPKGRPIRSPHRRGRAPLFFILEARTVALYAGCDVDGDYNKGHPITGITDCCAPAASGQVTADPVTTLMKSRRRIVSPRTQECADYHLRGRDYSRDLRPAEWVDRHFAWQQSPGPNVRFGSKADICGAARNVVISSLATWRWFAPICRFDAMDARKK